MKPYSATIPIPYWLLCCAGVSSMTLPGSPAVSDCGAAQLGTPEVLYLSGAVRDFRSTHPDFGITDPAAMGHYAKNVAGTLDLSGKPIYTAAGLKVLNQWIDKDGNPIAPYGDLGLFGGHFDVDVYDTAPSTNELYHEHQFDDKFNVTYVDIVNDAHLLFDSVVGGAYPNNLRVTMLNTHNGGGGTYTFDAGSGIQAGYTANGFDMVFDPGQLTQFRVDFVALAAMRATDPGTTHADAADRDDAFSIRMYDVTTNELVYELAVYHHFKEPKKGKKKKSSPPASQGNDACGVPINDTLGTFGTAGNGAISDPLTFKQWFRDIPGTNVSMMHSIALHRNAVGDYQYSTDSFFPIDNQLFGNGGDPHNNYFTYSFSARFTYHACTDMFFEFDGNDDAWVFINGQLVIDLGGVATPSKQYVALDRLNLVDGQEYSLDFFYAHRRATPLSVFNVRTNIELYTPMGTLPPVSSLYD